MATRLAKLNIDEVSGVANPANELPGWLVVKSDDPEVLLKEVDRMESDFAILYSSLQAVEQYLGEAPEEVQTSVGALSQYIETLFDDGQDDNVDDPADLGAPADAPIAASADKSPRSLLAKLMKRDEPVVAEPVVVEPARKTARERLEARREKLAKEAEEATAAEKAAAEAGDNDVAKSLSTIAEALGVIVEKQEEQGETQEALKTALGAALDRLSAVETTRKAMSPEDVAEVATKSSADRGTIALRSSLTALARQPGSSITIG